MRRIVTIPLILILFVLINSALIIEPSFSASGAKPAQFRSFFSINNIEVTEGTDPQAVFTVSLTYDGGVREFASSVNYATVNGTATAGSDFQQSSGTVNFPPGATPGGTVSMTVSIPIVDDSEAEGDETFTVVLNNPSPAFDIQGSGMCIIHDNDSGPTECTYSLQPMSRSFPGSLLFSEFGVFTVLAPSGCQWDIIVDAPPNFLIPDFPTPISGSSGFPYRVFANPSATPRTGRIHIQDIASGEIRQTHTVNQEGSNCLADGYSISPTDVVIESGGGSFSFDATAPPGCRPGQPSIDVDWITLDRCSDGGEMMDCRFDVRDNPGNFRTGTIDVSGQKFYVYQNPQGCPIELICAFVPGCLVGEAISVEIGDANTLELSRRFRDVKLARTSRGQNYIRLYYQFSSEAVQVMLFNPMFMLRSREILERYRPVLQAMVKGEQVALTRGDLDEIDSFLSSFAAKGSPDLQDAIKGVCRDLRDPQLHAEFGISVTEGPVREMPSQGQLQSLIRAGGSTALFAFSLVFVYRISRSRRKDLKRGLVVGLAMLFVSAHWTGGGQRPADSHRWPVISGQSAQIAESSAKLPIAFEANQGQADSQVKFICRAGDFNLFLTQTEAVMAMSSRDVLRMRAIAGNTAAPIEGIDKTSAVSNYFVGKGPAEWRASVPSYAKVRYGEVYPGVDMVYHGNQHGLEYDFIVAPGADPAAIRLGFEGTNGIEVDDNGELVLAVTSGEVRHRTPSVYQEVEGARRIVPARFILNQDQVVTFEVGEYDRSLPLVIDPVLSYSTYLGGSGIDEGSSIAVDEAGNTYVAGFTDSLNFPTVNASQPAFGGGQQDIFVVKLDPSGRMIYSTYLGGDGRDNATSIAIDSLGNAWVTGFTDSTNFPVRNAFQPNKAGLFNAIVARLDASGSLAYSTHLGGSTSDYGSSIVIDASGNVYVAGIATSANFPMANALQTSPGGSADLFVAKFDSTGRQLVYSTYLGGAGIDGASSIAVDAMGNLYVTGLTSSPNLRTANALQATHRGGLFDAFVAKLNPSGSDLVYSTFLGGSGEDRGFRIVADAAGNAYITGDTDSTNFPTANPVQTNNGGSADAFVAKLNPSGDQLVYSTYLGGSGIEGGTAIAVDGTGSATVTGFTSSANFPTVIPIQQAFGGGSFDGFVVKINATGATLDYATYLGGSGVDAGFGLAVDAAGSAYVMGQTESVDFPTVNPFQVSNGGGISDLFIAKIRPGPTITQAAIKRKHLKITGSGFEHGAVVLMDGEQQKTAFKSGTLLKGKKAAQKIAPGDTVQLQVRNPDGTTSAEFSFTRPAQ